MKICPVCQSSCSDFLDQCPADQVTLIRYDLRRELHSRRAFAASSNNEWFTPLPSQWLPMRLRSEVSFAAGELRRNPRRFLLGMIQSDADPAYRHSIQLSAAIVVTGISACFSVALLLIGLLRPAAGEASSPDKGRDDVNSRDLVLLSLVRPESVSGQRSLRHFGATGGSLREPQPTRGGGGGGQQMPEHTEHGETANALPRPPIIAPSLIAPKIENASLIVPETVFADPRSLPPMSFPVGDPSGEARTKSGGPGEEDGLGQGRQGGIGPNAGSGFGPGRLGGTGGGAYQPGGGPRTGNGSDDEIPWANSRLSPTIIYKEKARYTEQARQSQIQGTVVLQATFSADGRITDIRVIRGLPGGLTENAILAAQRIRFQPALSNGVPITVHGSLEFNFALY